MKRMSAIDRYWSKVEKTDGCWVWKGERLRTGYGKIKIDGRYWLAHRYAILLRDGGIPDGMFVCHSCDNPPCVRPDHLFVGTPGDNVRDMLMKGRSTALLAPEDVEPARAAYASGVKPNDIAERFNVPVGVIYSLVSLQSYSSFGDEIEFD